MIHGVGQQQRGEQLDTVVEPLVAFLGRALGHQNVEVKARTLVDEDGVATAEIHLEQDDGRAVEVWEVREAWWAESFRPSESGTIMAWAFRAFITNWWSTLHSVIRANIRAFFHEQPGVGVWRIPAGHWSSRLLNLCNWTFIMSGYTFVYLVGALLLLPVILFLQFPVRWIWPEAVGNIQLRLSNLITGGIGDQQAMTNRRVAIAGAADTVAKALFPFLAPPEQRTHSHRSAEYKTVTLIAHSGGVSCRSTPSPASTSSADFRVDRRRVG